MSIQGTTMMDAKTGKVPGTISETIGTKIKTGSAFMRLAKAVPMEKPQETFTFLTGVGAYWVGEGKKITATKPTFVNGTMVAKKLAVIIPTTKENLKHSIEDFFSLMEDEVAEAFYKKFDQSSFAGVDSPYLFNIKKSALAAGNVVKETSNKYDDISNAMGKIEDKDIDPNGIASQRKQKRKYRATKDNNGQPIFDGGTSTEPATVCDLPIAFASNDSFNCVDVTEVVGDWNCAFYGILSDIEYEVLTEATLTTIEAEDAPGEPVSLAERDMAALKATMEIGMIVVKDDAFAIVTKGEVPEDAGL